MMAPAGPEGGAAVPTLNLWSRADLVVAGEDIPGATNYVKAINTVAGETYPTGYTQGETITISGVAGARTITYAP